MNLTPRELANVLLGLRILQSMPYRNLELEEHEVLDGHALMEAEEIDELCEKINVVDDSLDANPPIIYDSWANEEDGEPGFVDRYTVIPRHGEFRENGDEGPTMFLGCSMGGRAFSQWGELVEPYDHENYSHLGKRVTLEELDEDTRRHILARITEEH